MAILSENEIKEIFESAYETTPEELLEFSIMLCNKCMICNHIFPAPALGTYILLEEWKSPFPEIKGGDKNQKGKQPKILYEDLLLALYILENGRGAAEELMKIRSEKFYKKKLNKEERLFPFSCMNILMKKYSSLDPRRAANELQEVLSLHSGLDMLPDEMEENHSSMILKSHKGKKVYSLWMENMMGILFFVHSILPSFSMEKILWDIPYSSLGFFFVRECRKNGGKGMGKEEVSRKLWQNFARKMEEKNGKK